MCGIDVWCVAEVVGVPGEVPGRLGGIVDAGGRREPGALRGRSDQSGER